MSLIAFSDAGGSCTTDHLAFTAQPSNAVTSASLGTVSVAVEDSGNNICTGDSTTSITLSKNGSATWGTLHSSSSLAHTVSSGVATWSDLYVDGATGSGAIDAAQTGGGGPTGATSSSITISAPSTTCHGAFSLLGVGGC